MPAPKLLDQVRATARLRHYSLSTEASYVNWIRRFILYHQKRQLTEMGAHEIRLFLTHLTVQELLVHSDVRTTMIYTHVLNSGGKGVRSSLDV